MKLGHIENPVAYFCAEFGIDNELPTYSGGLGILAADVINEAAIEHYPMVGIGVLYKGKDFLEHITAEGKAETRDSEFDHDTSFLRPTTIEGKQSICNLEFKSENVRFKSYHIRLSDTAILFFLSTDVDGNPSEWVTDMDTLYRGDSESQIRQQLLLGVGGIKLLNALEIKPKLYHINEGRPEFIIWELAVEEMKRRNISFEDAYKSAKEKIIYTNHTLIAAGNLTYQKEIVEKWAKEYTKDLNINPDFLIKDGVSTSDPKIFNTTLFALNISKVHSCVSKVHKEYAKRAWPNFNWVSITNGVNMLRWQDSDFRNPSLADREIWNQHMIKKMELMETVRKRTGFGYNPERLVITWARRLAEYKQPTQIFSDISRLKNIASNPDRPCQLLFAGNSHSGDSNSKSIIEQIIKIFSTELNGYAIFVPNYNISLANHLTSGSDVWLNTPKGNLEACGTSGMKAAANGVLNCTVLDGWTYEVNWDDSGWVLDQKDTAESFYEKLENEIAPLYYTRSGGLPIKWIQKMRASIELSKGFSSERVFEEYKKQLYF